jgi:hypothetical protein
VTNITDTQTYTERQLQDMPDAELDAVVEVTVFGRPAAKTRAFSSSWRGLGRLTAHLNQRGYTLHCNAFAPAHLLWLNSLPGTLSSGERYHPAEVRVVDIYKRQGQEPTEANLHVRAATLPRAVAIAAVLACQREQATIHQRRTDARKRRWSAERRRQQSEQMKEDVQRRRAAEAESSEGADPSAPPHGS